MTRRKLLTTAVLGLGASLVASSSTLVEYSANARGYGASAGMVARCLARLDEAGITGHVRITRALSDVNPIGTQGATFLVGRRPA